MIAETMHVARSLMEDIMRDGGVVKRLKYDKNAFSSARNTFPIRPPGRAEIHRRPGPHPARDGEHHAQGDQGRQNSEEQGKTLAGIMSDLNRRARDSQGKRTRRG
jgi:hypothetical protein